LIVEMSARRPASISQARARCDRLMLRGLVAWAGGNFEGAMRLADSAAMLSAALQVPERVAVLATTGRVPGAAECVDRPLRPQALVLDQPIVN
jgi:hypothetical protein